MPDQYGNPTEEEMRLRAAGYAPPQQALPSPLLGTQGQNSTGTGYSQATRDAVNARNSSGMSTLDQYINGQLVNHQERTTPERSGAANAPAFQGSAFMDDPFFSRSDVAPAISATNRDTLGGGAFGLRGWMRDHPGGTLAAFIAAAAGGAALAPAGTGAAGAGSTGAGVAGGTGAGVGFGGAGTAGIPANLAADFAGTTVGGGAAGQLAAAGGIAGGAGTGIGGSLGGGSGFLSQNSINNIARLQGLFGGDKSQSGGSIPYIQPVLGNQQKPQQQPDQRPSLIGLPTNTQMPLLPARGYTPHNFYGATVWS